MSSKLRLQPPANRYLQNCHPERSEGSGVEVSGFMPVAGHRQANSTTSFRRSHQGKDHAQIPRAEAAFGMTFGKTGTSSVCVRTPFGNTRRNEPRESSPLRRAEFFSPRRKAWESGSK